MVSEDWIVEINADALDCVEIVAVVAMVTIEPDKFRFWAAAVMRRDPSAVARAVI